MFPSSRFFFSIFVWCHKDDWPSCACLFELVYGETGAFSLMELLCAFTLQVSLELWNIEWFNLRVVERWKERGSWKRVGTRSVISDTRWEWKKKVRCLFQVLWNEKWTDHQADEGQTGFIHFASIWMYERMNIWMYVFMYMLKGVFIFHWL